MAVSCVSCLGWDYHGPGACCVPEPSGNGAWVSDVMPSGGLNSYSYSYPIPASGVSRVCGAALLVLPVARRPHEYFPSSKEYCFHGLSRDYFNA